MNSGVFQWLLLSLLLRQTIALTTPTNRRSALLDIAAAFSACAFQPGISGAVTTPPPPKGNDVPFLAYQVVPDASAALNPTLTTVKKEPLLKKLSKTSGALWLGEHHNAERDHILQTEIIRKVHAQRSKNKPVAIGLEQVQLQFQPVLDDYVAGKISVEEMKDNVEWEKRWQWPFEGYRPIFETARELKIPLIALNVNSEDLALVESGGLPNLPRQTLSQYIPDRAGFAAFASPIEYKVYVDYVIQPSYVLHKEMGLLQYTISGQKLDQEMPFRNFFSGRILWDESMASKAFEWTEANPEGLLIGLVGADHVKFRDGVPGRFARQAKGTKDCTSVMLNPTLIDTRPSGSVGIWDNSYSPDQITLQLRYVKEGVDLTTSERFLPENTGGVLPLADFIVINA